MSLRTIFKTLIEILKTVGLVILIALALRYFVIQPFLVSGLSMEPNFKDGDYLLVEKVSYRFRRPQRGEVIVFHPPDRANVNYIKRIIGLPGEKVEINGRQIKIEGKALKEPYILGEGGLIAATYSTSQRLGPDEYFVLGDNRFHSSDSREWGAFHKKNIIGRALVIAYPFKDWGLVKAPLYSL